MAYALAVSPWYLRRKRSTRPAVSTSRCLPVKYGWHMAHTSTWMLSDVERVSNELPHAHTAFTFLYWGCRSAFTYRSCRTPAGVVPDSGSWLLVSREI